MWLCGHCTVSAPGSLVNSFLWRWVLRSARAAVTPRTAGCARCARAFAVPPPPPLPFNLPPLLPLALAPPLVRCMPPAPECFLTLLAAPDGRPSPEPRLSAALAAAPQARHSLGAQPCMVGRVTPSKDGSRSRWRVQKAARCEGVKAVVSESGSAVAADLHGPPAAGAGAPPRQRWQRLLQGHARRACLDCQAQLLCTEHTRPSAHWSSSV